MDTCVRVAPDDGTPAGDVPSGARADAAEWALARHDVHVHPAHFYDLAGDDLVVLSLITDPSTFEEALVRLAG